jgi:hypothetical protein
VQKISIPLRDKVRDALWELSEKEYREPKQQAALLLEKALRDAGALREPSNEEPANARA